jgi:hypothetical protein
MFCVDCGSELAAAARFCATCGRQAPGQNSARRPAPATPVAAIPLPGARLPRQSVAVAALLSVLTFGQYTPFWFLTRRRALNGLNSSVKMGVWMPVLISAFFALAVAIGITNVIHIGNIQIENPALSSAAQFAAWTGAIGAFIEGLAVRYILQSHLRSIQHPTPYVAAWLVYLFGVISLQHVINSRLSEELR